MSGRCYSLAELGVLAETAAGGLDDAHVAGCPRCRARLRSLRSFQDPADLPAGADRASARRTLQAALADEIGAGKLVTPGPGFWKRPRLAAFAVAAMVAAAVVGAGLFSPPWRHPAPSGELRGDVAAPGPTATRTPDGGLRLAWPAVQGADAYQVILFDSTLREVHRLDAGSSGSLTLTADDLDGLDPAALWRVAALKGGDRIGLSAPARLPAP